MEQHGQVSRSSMEQHRGQGFRSSMEQHGQVSRSSVDQHQGQEFRSSMDQLGGGLPHHQPTPDMWSTRHALTTSLWAACPCLSLSVQAGLSVTLSVPGLDTAGADAGGDSKGLCLLASLPSSTFMAGCMVLQHQLTATAAAVSLAAPPAPGGQWQAAVEAAPLAHTASMQLCARLADLAGPLGGVGGSTPPPDTQSATAATAATAVTHGLSAAAAPPHGGGQQEGQRHLLQQHLHASLDVVHSTVSVYASKASVMYAARLASTLTASSSTPPQHQAEQPSGVRGGSSGGEGGDGLGELPEGGSPGWATAASYRGGGGSFAELGELGAAWPEGVSRVDT